MKKRLLILFFACSVLPVSAQLDYRKMKDTICPAMTYCGIRDSASLSVIYPKLLAIDTALLCDGIAEYYHDLAHVLTDLSLRNEPDTIYRRLSLSAIQKYLYHRPDDYAMIWNAACDCQALDDCERAHYYLKWYREACPKRYWMKDQVAVLLMFCPDEELKRKFKIKDKTPR